MIYLMIKPLYYRCQIWKDDATALLAWDQTKVVAAAVWQKKRGRLGLLQIGYVTKHKKGGSKFIAINLGIRFSVLLIIKCGLFWENWLFLMDEAKNKTCTRHILIRLITQKSFWWITLRIPLVLRMMIFFLSCLKWGHLLYNASSSKWADYRS